MISDELQAGRPRPAALDAVCGALLAGLLVVSFLPFSYALWRVTWQLGWVVLLGAVAVDREGSLGRRALIATALTAAWAAGMAVICDRADDLIDSDKLLHWLWVYKIWPQWLLSAWLASWFFDSRSSPRIDWSIRVLVGLLVAFAFWQSIATPASLNNPRSINFYGRDMGTYLVVMLLIARLWTRGRGGLAMVYRVAVTGAAVQIIAALAMAVVAALSDDEARRALAEYPAQFILVHPDLTWRLRFPLKVHNQLGLAMFVNSIILALAWVGLRRRRIAIVLPGLIAGAFVAAMLSMTRGALVAIVLGFAPLIVARGRRLRRRWPLALALALPAIAFLAYTPYRTMVASIFTPQTWTSTESSIGHRVSGWRGAGMMMDDHPWTGVGYSMETFRKLYREKYINPTDGREYMVHSHNTFLEFGAESGIPALVIFIALMGFRWWALGRALIRRPGDSTLLLLAGFELAMFVFIQFFFMHKRTQGIMLWAFWIWATLYCLDAARGVNNQIASEEAS